MRGKRLLMLLLPFFFLGCFPYVYYNQDEVAVKGIDVDQTIEVAKVELEEGGFDSILTIWAMRDQMINAGQAVKISDLYFKYIDKQEGEFQVWHFAWAISNYYRNNSSEVKAVLQTAYDDAKKRPDTLKQFKDIANLHINGDKIYMGDIHGLGRAYARSHIVAPGNKDYVQSFDEYMQNKLKEKKK